MDPSQGIAFREQALGAMFWHPAAVPARPAETETEGQQAQQRRRLRAAPAAPIGRETTQHGGQATGKATAGGAAAPADGRRQSAPVRLPWDDPHAEGASRILLYSSQFAAQSLAQETLPETLAEAPQQRQRAISAYAAFDTRQVQVIGPAFEIGHLV